MTRPWKLHTLIGFLMILLLGGVAVALGLRHLEQQHWAVQPTQAADGLLAALDTVADPARREEMLRAWLAANPEIGSALLQERGGATISMNAGNRPRGSAPDWFRGALALDLPALEIGATGDGGPVLRLNPDTGMIHERLWVQWLSVSGLLAASLLMALPLLFLLLRQSAGQRVTLQRTLSRLDGGGETAARDSASPAHLQERLQRLETERDELKRTLQRVQDAVFAVDSGGSITLWTPAAELLFGYPAGEILGQPVARLVPAWKQEEIGVQLEQVRAGASLHNLSTQHLHRNGYVLEVLCSITPLPRDGGGFLFSVRDVGELRELERPIRLRSTAMQASGCCQLILEAGGEHRIVEANTSAIRLLGSDRERLELTPFPDLFERSLNGELLDRLSTCLETGSRCELALLHRSEADTPPRRLQVGIQPLPGRSPASGHLLAELHDDSVLMNVEERLRSREAQLGNLIGQAPIGLAITDPSGRVESVNPAFCTLLGRTCEEIAGHDLQALIEEDTQALLHEAVESRGKNRELHLRDSAQRRLTVLASLAPMEQVTPAPGFVLYVMDITARKRAEQSLYKEIERATVTLEAIADAVITTSDTGVVEYLNPVAEQLTGWNSREAQGLELSEILHLVNETTREPEQDPVQRCLRLGRRIEISEHAQLLRSDGREIAVQISASPIYDRVGRIAGSVLILHEVTAMRQQVRRMSYEARHDPLTGLYNRREFQERLGDAVERAREEKKPSVLCYLDLDNFKTVNDSGGHVAGDELLKQVAALLRGQIRDSDVLARLGGDEFAVLLQGCSLERGTQVAEGLCSAIREFRFAWKDNRFDIGVSVGLVPLNDTCASAEAALKSADAACYEAKEAGRNTVRVHRPDPDEQHTEVRSLRRVLQAVERDRLVLFRQSIHSLVPGDSRTMGEILVRLADDQGRLLNPRSFLPAAVRYERMVEVDRWVVGTLFAQLGEQRQEDTGNALLFVNLSVQSIADERFLGFVVEQAERNGLHPEQICLELDENELLSGYTRIVRFMQSLREKGFQFALDDFGSSLTPFSYLKGLPVSYLKFSRQVITDLAASPVDQSILRAMTGVARQMGIRTVAKQLEDESLVPLLTELGVDYIQGYAVAAPVPLRGTGTTVPVPNGLESGSES